MPVHIRLCMGSDLISDKQISNLVNNLPGEIMGLLLHDQAVTGFSIDTILVQSLFLHYPGIFGELKLDLEYFLLFDHTNYSYLTELSNLVQMNEKAVIFDLFELGDPQSIDPPIFPERRQFLPILAEHEQFVDFLPSQRFTTLVEKLILQYHLMIQPEGVVVGSIKGNPEWFQVIHLDLTHKQAMTLLGQVSFDVYNIRRVDYEVKKRVFARHQTLTQLHLDQTNQE